MADVFISYHMESAGETAGRISETLERDGISCWYAGRDTTLRPFEPQIVRAIHDCRVFLLILNQQSMNSAHVATETKLAFNRYARDNHQIGLILFHIDESDLLREQSEVSDTILYYTTLFFRRIEGFPPDEAHIGELKKAITTAFDGVR